MLHKHHFLLTIFIAHKTIHVCVCIVKPKYRSLVQTEWQTIHRTMWAQYKRNISALKTKNQTENLIRKHLFISLKTRKDYLSYFANNNAKFLG